MARKLIRRTPIKARTVSLVSVSEYADRWNIDRSTVYNLIKQGKLTRYEMPNGRPLLDPQQRPSQVKKWGEKRKRKIE